MNDRYSLEARVADLETRLSRLDGNIFTEIASRHLNGLYLEVVQFVSDMPTTIDFREARTWVRLLVGLNVQGLVMLARHLRDPFPWQPFLVLADRLAEDYSEGVVVQEHILLIAEKHLSIQGLYPVLTPRTIGPYVPVLQRALFTTRTTSDLPGYKDAD